jgi:hypothetical protein
MTRTSDWTAELSRRIRIAASLYAHGDRSDTLDALRDRLHAMRRTSCTDTREYSDTGVGTLLREFDAYWHGEPIPRRCPWCGAVTDQCPSCERPAPEPMPQYEGPLPELGAEEDTT